MIEPLGQHDRHDACPSLAAVRMSILALQDQRRTPADSATVARVPFIVRASGRVKALIGQGQWSDIPILRTLQSVRTKSTSSDACPHQRRGLPSVCTGNLRLAPLATRAWHRCRENPGYAALHGRTGTPAQMRFQAFAGLASVPRARARRLAHALLMLAPARARATTSYQDHPFTKAQLHLRARSKQTARSAKSVVIPHLEHAGKKRHCPARIT